MSWRLRSVPLVRRQTATVTLTLSDDAELAALNEAHMGKSGADRCALVPAAAALRLPARIRDRIPGYA